MPFSSFVLTTSHPTQPDRMLCLNTLTDHSQSLSRSLYITLLQHSHPATTASPQDRHDFAALRQAQCLQSPPGHSRTTEHAQVLHTFAGWAQSRYLITLCPTLDCNLHCTYCYEANIRHGGAMTRDTLQHALTWVDTVLVQRPRPVTLTFYGGEPLLSPLLPEASRRFARLGQRRHLPITLRIQTNGTPLTPTCLQQLQTTLHPRTLQLQVSLDGPPAMHDARRAFRDGRGTFATILTNLQQLAPLPNLEVTIRVNLDHENLPSMPALLATLHRYQTSLPPQIALQFAPVLPTTQPYPFLLTPDDAVTALTRLWHLSWRWGWNTLSPLRYAPCSDKLGNGVVIDPDGYVYTCEGVVGDPRYAVTHVRDPSRFHWRTTLPPVTVACVDQCLGQCPVLPYCMGGCRYRAPNQPYTPTTLHCERPLLEAIAIARLQTQYTLMPPSP